MDVIEEKPEPDRCTAEVWKPDCFGLHYKDRCARKRKEDGRCWQHQHRYDIPDF